MVYWSIEPPWWDRLERAVAILTTLMANVNRDPRKGYTFELKDFLPDYWKEPDPEDGMAPEHVMGIMEGFMRAQEHREKVKGKVLTRPLKH